LHLGEHEAHRDQHGRNKQLEEAGAQVAPVEAQSSHDYLPCLAHDDAEDALAPSVFFNLAFALGDALGCGGAAAAICWSSGRGPEVLCLFLLLGMASRILVHLVKHDGQTLPILDLSRHLHEHVLDRAGRQGVALYPKLLLDLYLIKLLEESLEGAPRRLLQSKF